MLQFALLLFAIGLVVFLKDLDISAAEVVLAVTGVGCTFYACIAVIAMIWKDCPFQTSLSFYLPKAWVRAKEAIALARSRLKDGLRRRPTVVQLQTEPPTEHSEKKTNMIFSNPAFWRRDPLFTPLLPEDPSASGGFWLLEHSTDFSAATAVAAVFPEFQWPSHHPCTTALVRLRDTYLECFRLRHKPNKSTRLKALQSAAAYYVLYHTQFLWYTAKGLDAEMEKLSSDLPHDLLVYKHSEEWDRLDLFEYLLKTNDRSESVTSARFLSYIAPYWVCGESDISVKVRPDRCLEMGGLIQELEDSQELDLATITNCLLSVGALMHFPLHPEDLIRVDKRCVRLHSHVHSGIDCGQRLPSADLEKCG